MDKQFAVGVDYARQTQNPRQVDDQVQLLDKALCELSSCLDYLEERLQPVVHGGHAEGKQSGAQVPQPVLVPLAERLRGLTQSAEQYHRRISSITERLEL